MKRKYLLMHTRRMPGVDRKGFACYKTDGETKSAELEMLEKLNTATEAKYKELREQFDLKTKEISELTTATKENEAKVKEYETAVAGINEILGEKGATLKQIQDEVKELQAKAGQIKNNVPEGKLSIKDLLMKEFNANIEKCKSYREDVHNQNNPLPLFQTKAVGTMTTSANVTGVSIDSIPTFATEFAVRGRQLVHARDLLRTIETATGTYIFMRQNIPAGEGSVAVTTQPGATKTKRDYDNTMISVITRYRAGTVDIANEMVQDIPGMGQYITEELTEDYLRTETFDFMDAIVTGATGSSALTTATTVTAEKITYWVANLEQQNYQPSDIVVRPSVWALLLNTKPSDYSRPGGYVVLPDGSIIFAGVRLVKCSTNALADDKVLIGDFRKAIIVQKSGEGFRVQLFNQHDQAVYANLTTFRGEARAALALLRPDAFVYGGIGTT